MDEKTRKLVKQEIYQAIAFFIERQQLVAQAILDFGLNLQDIGEFGSLGWVSSVSRTRKNVAKPLDRFTEGSDFYEVSKRAETLQVPQEGIWRDDDHNEWEYFLHGGGCRLTNPLTKECIDWDCPNRLAFDPWFFRFHLEWQLDASKHKDQLIHTRDWIQEMRSRESERVDISTQIKRLIDEMIDDGLINKDWTLAKKRTDSKEND